MKEARGESSADNRVLLGEVSRLALPVIGEHLGGVALGIVNMRLIGHLGAAALAGVSLSTQWILLTNILIGALAMGATAIVARSVGASDWDTTNRTLRQVMLLGVGIGLISMVLALLFAEPAMALMGAEPEALALGATYLRITSIIFALAVVISMSGACLRAAGDTRTPMVVITLGHLVSMVLSWAAINGMLGLPRMGVAGVALGMAVGCTVSALLYIGLLLKGHSGLKLDLRDLRLDLRLLKRVLRIGLPKGIECLVLHLAMMVFFRIVAGLGTVAVAANAVALRVESLSLMPSMGLAMASTTLVGQRLGAGDPKRAERSGYLAYKVCACWMTLMGLVFIFFPRILIGFFTDDPMVIEMAVTPLRIAGFFAPLVAAELIFSACLLGAGDTRFPMIITCVSGWLLRVGGAVVLGLSLGLGLAGVWLGRASDVAVRGVILFLRFRGGRWKDTRV